MLIANGHPLQRYKVIGNGKCTEFPQNNLDSQVKSTLHTLYTYPPRSKLWSVSLYDQPFSRYGAFCNAPLTPMLKFQSATIFLNVADCQEK